MARIHTTLSRSLPPDQPMRSFARRGCDASQKCLEQGCVWREGAAAQGSKWSHACSVVCSANPKKKKKFSKNDFYFISSSDQKKHNTKNSTPSSKTPLYSSFYLACMVQAWCSRCNSPVQLPPLLPPHDDSIGGTQSLGKKKKGQ